MHMCCPLQAGVWYIDFLPLNPTAPGTALLLLTGGRAPGVHTRAGWRTAVATSAAAAAVISAAAVSAAEAVAIAITAAVEH